MRRRLRRATRPTTHRRRPAHQRGRTVRGPGGRWGRAPGPGHRRGWVRTADGAGPSGVRAAVGAAPLGPGPTEGAGPGDRWGWAVRGVGRRWGGAASAEAARGPDCLGAGGLGRPGRGPPVRSGPLRRGSPVGWGRPGGATRGPDCPRRPFRGPAPSRGCRHPGASACPAGCGLRGGGAASGSHPSGVAATWGFPPARRGRGLPGGAAAARRLPLGRRSRTVRAQVGSRGWRGGWRGVGRFRGSGRSRACPRGRRPARRPGRCRRGRAGRGRAGPIRAPPPAT